MKIDLIVMLTLFPLIFTGCAANRQPEPAEFFREITAPVNTPVQQSETPTPPSAPTDLAPITLTGSDESVKLAWFHNPVVGGAPEELAADYDIFILTRLDEGFRDSLKSLGSEAKFLMFIGFESIHYPGACDDQPWYNQAAFNIGDFCAISEDHPDWFLLNSAGERVVLQWETEQFYYMDPANEGWQNFLLGRIQQMRAENGWDGIFMDNMDASLGRFSREGIQLAKYPTDASLQEAHARLLSRVRNELANPEGFPVFANITYLKDNGVYLRYLQYLDGAMIENFAVDWNLYYDAATWHAQLDAIEQAQAAGRHFILVAQGAQNDLNREAFSLASYLLINNGNLFFRYTDDDLYNRSWLYDNYQVKLGSPLGARYQQDGEWQRDFEYGTVRVNPQTHSASIEVK